MRDLLLAAVNRMESKGLSIRQNCMEFESEKVRGRERQSKQAESEISVMNGVLTVSLMVE